MYKPDVFCYNVKVYLYLWLQIPERGAAPLQSKSAVILIPKDAVRTGLARPMLLQHVMGAPLLAWLISALAQQGFGRFFLACQDRFLNEARVCFPDGCALTICVDREAADPLNAFLFSGGEEQVLIITGPCIFLPPGQGIADAPKAACACRVPRRELMAVLEKADFSFSQFLLSHGTACTDRDGFYTISTKEQLQGWAERIRRAHLQDLTRQGVEIWDEHQCYVDPGVRIGSGTVLMPGSILRGRTVVGSDCVIGPNSLLENTSVGNGCRINASQLYESSLGNDCTVGPFACIRHGSVLGSRVRVGTAAELNGVRLGEGTHAGALCSLRELDSGRDCMIGPGCVCAADLQRSAECVHLEDRAIIAGGAIFAGPITVGRSAAVGAGTTLYEAVPPQTLTMLRGRHTVCRDMPLQKQ